MNKTETYFYSILTLSRFGFYDFLEYSRSYFAK